ncbi:MAG: nucleotidyl transferase AbiEii/AbiGii toxin family protein [Planctomycetes bacterium]|nr:nucleotidyl transferase AbiEii/AbiGii toxin family protein [Planctomycetota bacterium]
MTRRRPTNIAASVRQRLQNLARESNRPFQEVLQYFAMERFLYRLSRSAESGQFVLKGALLLTVWRSPATRPTKDIDFLARMSNEIAGVVAVMRTICGQDVEDDGLRFDADSVTGRAIREDADYEGIRVVFQAYLGRARVQMQIDLGFGDVMTPPPALTEFPTLLEFAAPVLYAYSRETMIAEKFEAMTKLGELNTRMKDFFDIWLLSQQFTFDGETLRSAIDRTFANRHSVLTVDPVALSDDFAGFPGKQQQWEAFLNRSRLMDVPKNLEQVVRHLRTFLQPVVEAAAAGIPFSRTWRTSGDWS